MAKKDSKLSSVRKPPRLLPKEPLDHFVAPEVVGPPGPILRAGAEANPRKSEKVGGCLAAHWEAWANISQDPWVVSVLKEGYQIPFKGDLPPLSTSPIAFQSYHPTSPQFLALEKEVSEMIDKNAVEEAPLPLIPGYYARIFVVPKGDKGLEWRPIIDLSRLNLYIRQSPFKMETSRSVLQSIRPSDFLITVDLKDAYLLEMNSIRLECQMVPDGATKQPINKFKIFWSRF